MTGEEMKMRGVAGMKWQCVYLDETRITAVRATVIPRHRARHDGYGTLIPGTFLLQIDGKRWHRVRTTCWSNAGTDFVLVGGQQLALASGWYIRWGLAATERLNACHATA